MATGFLAIPGVKADVSAMIDIAAKLGIDLPKGRSAAKIAPALRAAFAKRLASIPEDDWIGCDKCGEKTDDAHEIDRCPYCGDLGEIPTAESAGDDDSELDSDSEGSGSDDFDDATDLAGDAQESAEDNGVFEAESPDDVEVCEPPTADVSTEAEAESAVVVVDSAIALGDVDSRKELELEKSIIREASLDIRRKAYLLGQSLKRVFDGELWQCEGHSGFNKFLASIRVDSSMAYKLMQVVNEFTEAQVLEIGWTKLSIVARLPEGEREHATERAANGVSRSQLEAEVRGEVSQPPAKERDVGEAPTSLDPLNEGFTKGRPRKQDQEITLLTKVGGKAESHNFVDRETRKSVNKWHDNTFGEVKISDNVSMFVMLRVGSKGEIKGFTTAFRRVYQDADAGADADAENVAAE